MRTVQANVALEDDAFELLNKHLKTTNMDLGVFLSLLVHSRITEMASLGFLRETSAASTGRLIAEYMKFNELSLTQIVSDAPETLRAEDLVCMDSDVHPAFYEAQLRVMGTA